MTTARTTAIVVAPTGDPMFWARGDTAEAAILEFLPTIAWWQFAQSQGYHLKWLKRERKNARD